TPNFWLCQAMGAVVMGVLSLWAGYLIVQARARPARAVPFLLRADQEIRLSWIMGLYGIGLGLHIYMFSRGFYGYLMVRSAYFEALAESQVLSQLSLFGRFGFALAAIDFFRHPDSRR